MSQRANLHSVVVGRKSQPLLGRAWQHWSNVSSERCFRPIGRQIINLRFIETVVELGVNGRCSEVRGRSGSGDFRRQARSVKTKMRLKPQRHELSSRARIKNYTVQALQPFA